MRRAALAAAAAVVLAAAGCTGSQTSTAPPVSTPTVSRSLVAAADLPPCPTTAATAQPRERGLPDVTLACLGTGPAVHLAGLAGTPTVVNLWQSDCQPCQAETPLLVQTHDALGARVRFLGVDTVETVPDSALSFLAAVRPHVSYPSVLDPDRTLLDRYGVGLPVTLLVDATGAVVHVQQGAYTKAALDADLARYLGVHA